MNRSLRMVYATFGVLAVLVAFSVYLLADSAGSTSGVEDSRAAAGQQQEQPGLDAGIAPAGSGAQSEIAEPPEVEEAVSAEALAGQESGVVAGEQSEQELAMDAMSAGVSAQTPPPAGAGLEATPEAETPTEFTLSQNYPNPFNPSTTIAYTLPVDAHVTLEVFDIVGRQVALMVDELVPAGFHNAVFDASTLSSGSYIYRLTAKAPAGVVFTRTAKMLLAK